MPFYADLDSSQPDGRRTIEQLLKLRAQLEHDIPPRTFQETLLLATWNIREFDSTKYGIRTPEALYYIAEIIDRFDIVAVQEVRGDLTALKRLCEILGGFWDYIVTDVTEGTQGNDERMAFLYDNRKVHFGGLASQLVLPPVRLKKPDGTFEFQPVTQIARTPFMGGFKAGWTDFILTTVHILYGDDKPDDPRRVEEIRQVAQHLRGRTLDPNGWSRNLILLGDFNIYAPTDVTMQALLDAEFIVPPQLQHLPTNIPQTKFYDQIAFRVREGKLDTTGKAGVFNYYKTVFREADESIYAAFMGEGYAKITTAKKKTTYYKDWRTYQMSDHLPMWVELRINYSDAYLSNKIGVTP